MIEADINKTPYIKIFHIIGILQMKYMELRFKTLRSTTKQLYPKDMHKKAKVHLLILGQLY